MADIRPITSNFSAAPQITEADFATIKAKGYTMVINNRPDGESSDQMSSARAAELARAHGLEYRHIPVSGMPTQTALNDMVAALNEAKGPVLAHCRSGARSTNLWALAESARGGKTAAELVSSAANGGYDVSGLVPQMRQLGAK
jgi:sulfide:quinone oxidoreductase